MLFYFNIFIYRIFSNKHPQCLLHLKVAVLITITKPHIIKKSKYQQYLNCSIVCILVPYAFWVSFQQNIVSLPISAISRGLVLISILIPRGAALIRGQRLFETKHSLEEIQYTICMNTLIYRYIHIYIYGCFVYKFI